MQIPCYLPKQMYLVMFKSKQFYIAFVILLTQLGAKPTWSGIKLTSDNPVYSSHVDLVTFNTNEIRQTQLNVTSKSLGHILNKTKSTKDLKIRINV
jgi:hypothetical protein